ncbi:hypothetical protein GCM10007939_23350 [Amylibacter marinus]|uniref:DUF3592 domain-containing protein n=1 Tax=Amylibacter marinus TaxID=1475483 RepID=A0ABQ5VXT7_9RHOB|nr:DUF3592 domain-containing protein [Amylibacter marinus]GLQ36051.1 hypothetical protein GCM10007939_23350 [Amylibacter marinus]
MTLRNPLLIAGPLFLIVSFALMGVGYVLFGKNNSWEKQGVEVIALVTKVDTRLQSKKKKNGPGRLTKTLYSPVYRIQDQDGNVVEYASDVWSSETNFSVGQQVDALYNPNSGKIIAKSSQGTNSLISYALMAAGALFFVISLLIIRASLRRRS